MPSPPERIPKSRKSSISRALNSILLTMMFGLLAVAGAAFLANRQINAPGPLQDTKVHEVESGWSSRQIASSLHDNDIIHNAELFLISNYLLQWLERGSLKAGDYEIPKQASIRDIIKLMRTGKVLQHKITIPEGLTTHQALARIQNHPQLSGKLTYKPAEGALLPDTYIFRRGSDRNELIKRMQSAQQKLLIKLWNRRSAGLPITNIGDAVILASIVEKETALAEERPRIASVFVNRLRRGMRLQSDPTIIYGITEGKEKLGRPIRRSDLSRKTAYNTYVIDGLPPTPIANPGKESLAAVLNPLNTDDLFFVADGTGGHVFAETLPEHQRNVRKWRQVERAQKQQQAALENNEPEVQPEPEPAPADSSENTVAEPNAGETEVNAAAAELAQPVPEPSPEPGVEPSPGTIVQSEQVIPIPRRKPQRP